MNEATSTQTLSDDVQFPHHGTSRRSLDRKLAHMRLQLHQVQGRRPTLWITNGSQPETVELTFAGRDGRCSL
jgi:hypothetical protein